MIATRLGILLLALLCVVPAQARPLDEISELWRARQYKQVIDELLAYRNTLFGRNVEVDYMLATSFCKHPGDESYGRAVLQHILQVYELSDDNRVAVGTELENCGRPPEPMTVAFLTTRSSGGRSVVRGKSFYSVGGGNKALGGDPLQAEREIPSQELQRRLFAIGDPGARDAMAGRLGDNATAYLSERFVIGSISGHSEAELQEIARLLERALDFFLSEYAVTLPPTYISVYLVPDANLLRQMGGRLHGLKVAPGTIGYSFRNDMSAMAVVRGPYTGTLKHELVHLLVRTNFGDIPPWLDEGLAALYEVSRQEAAYLRGLPNWRGEVLTTFWHNEPRVADLLGMNWSEFDAQGGSMEQQAVNHALARYWVLYLQDTEKLTRVYGSFRDRDIKSPVADTAADARARVESAAGRSLDELEEDFQRWFREINRALTAQEVMEVQQRLIELGYHPGVVDGVAGGGTRAAVRAFKRDRSYSIADGQIDASLLVELRISSGVQPR